MINRKPFQKNGEYILNRTFKGLKEKSIKERQKIRTEWTFQILSVGLIVLLINALCFLFIDNIAF